MWGDGSRGSVAVLVNGTSITRGSSEYKLNPSDRDNNIGKPSKVGTERPHQPHHLLWPPAEGTWQRINLLQSQIQPTQFLFITSYNPGRPLPTNSFSFLLLLPTPTLSSFPPFFFFFFLDCLFVCFLLHTERCCIATDSAQDRSRGHHTAVCATCSEELHKDEGAWLIW